MRFVSEIVLIAVLLNAVLLDKAANILSAKELKRRARTSHANPAAKLYKVVAYGRSLDVFLWLSGSVAAAILVVQIFSGTWWLALIFVAVLAFIIRGWHVENTKSWVWRAGVFVAPANAKVLSYLQPLMVRLQRGHLPLHVIPSKVYEKEDLLELLNLQNNRPENRVPEDELKMAFNALTFGEKKVGEVMTPMRKVRLVSAGEQVGPLLMDELHQTGFSRFPVTAGGKKDTNPEIVGTLMLRDLVGYTGSGPVSSLMKKQVYYINETQGLRDALGAFIKTHFHIFVVVNNFEEVVGVLTIEDVLEQILGQRIVDEFDKYDDLRAVAGIEAKKEQASHQHVASTEPPAEHTDQ